MCVAAQNEERHQSELVKWSQYQRADHRSSSPDRFERSSKKPTGNDHKDKVEKKHLVVAEAQVTRAVRSTVGIVRRQGVRQEIVASQSRRALEAQGLPLEDGVQSDTKDNPLKYLLSDSEDEEFCVGVIHVTDGVQGSSLEEYLCMA